MPDTTTDQAVENPSVAARTPLSRADRIAVIHTRIAALKEQVEKLEQEELIAQQFASVEAGSLVDIKVGRGDTRRVVSGTVLQRTEEGGRVYYKVLVQGDDVELFRVQQADVVAVHSTGDIDVA